MMKKPLLFIAIASSLLLSGAADAGEPVPSTWQASEGRILYIAENPENFRSLVTVKPDGSDPRVLVEGEVISGVWSPDGTKIAYADGDHEAYVVDADGSNKRLISPNRGGYNSVLLYAPAFSWSPDSEKVLFSYGFYLDCCDDSRSRVMSARADGSSRTWLTGRKKYSFNPSWSPTGSHIAYSRSRGESTWLVVMRADGTEKTFISPGAHQATWAPDGGSLAFGRVSPHYLATDLVVSDLTGAEQRVLAGGTGHRHSPQWSPDGSRIAYAYGRISRQSQIHTISPDGSSDRQITYSTRSDHSTFAWSPTGAYIVYGEADDIFITTSDGLVTMPVSFDPDLDERFPDW